LPPARVIVLPIGSTSPDAPESIPTIKDGVAQSFKDVEAALAEPVAQIAP
jgi:hypothetical protein